MEISFYLLLFFSHLGVFDVLYFHVYKCQLHKRAECQREVFWHILRHLIYALQFAWVAHLRFHGWALLLLGVLYFFDIFVAWADVLEENRSRAAQGGLPRGEYFMHVVLSVLVGCYLMATIQAVWLDFYRPTNVVYNPPAVPLILRLYMTGMAIIAFGNFVFDFYKWLKFRRQTEAYS